MKLCGKMVEAGQAYNSANKLFLSSLAELLSYQKKETVVMVRRPAEMMGMWSFLSP